MYSIAIELVPFVALALLGALPWIGLRTRKLSVLLFAAPLAALVVAFVTRGSAIGPGTQPVVTNRPIEVQNDGYASSRTCRACHPQQYATWHASYHRTMTQVANDESVVGSFDNIRLSRHGRRYRLFRKNGKYWVGIKDEAAKVESAVHEIVMTTGSHHLQFYWFASGESRALGSLPFVYLLSEQRWVPADSTFLRPPSAAGSQEVGQWNQGCVNCHTTHGKSRVIFASPDSMNKDDVEGMDTQVGEFGIACEACHGPCEQHGRRNNDPLHRYALHLGTERDGAAVQPEELSASKGAQVCGQCHSVSLPKSNEHLRRIFADGFDYRPGHDFFGPASDRIVVQTSLHHPAIDQRLAYEPQYLATLFWPDGMIRVAGREFNGLIESPCYQHQDETKGIMTCMSCHVMHPHSTDSRSLESWADDQLKEGMRGDIACVQCHTEYRERAVVAEHTHHADESAGSRCYNCHMPHTTYGLLKGIRSHTVAVPSVDESVQTRRPNACNLCHLDETLKWTASHLQDWYGVQPPPLTEDQENVAASILWALRGDAGTRVLVAWHMGWEPAMQASNSAWMPPYLAVFMGDAYDAVRYVGYHSLRKHPGYEHFAYDYMSPDDRSQAMKRVTSIWEKSKDRSSWSPDDHLLLRENGDLVESTFLRLLRERDNRPVLLNE